MPFTFAHPAMKDGRVIGNFVVDSYCRISFGADSSDLFF